MKRNMFGDDILQQGDDIAAHFSETHGTEGPFTAADIDLDPTFDWCASVHDEEMNEVQVHDFEDEPSLLAWLTQQEVRIT